MPELDYLTFGCFTDVSSVVPSATWPPGPISCADLSIVGARLVFTPVDVVQDCLVQPLPCALGQTETHFTTAIISAAVLSRTSNLLKVETYPSVDRHRWTRGL